MLVSDAQRKICPFILAVDKGGWSKDNGQPANTLCQVDKCMAWVYVKTHKQIENKSIASDEKVCMNRYSDGEELPEDKKEGICVRLSR